MALSGCMDKGDVEEEEENFQPSQSFLLKTVRYSSIGSVGGDAVFTVATRKLVSRQKHGYLGGRKGKS